MKFFISAVTILFSAISVSAIASGDLMVFTQKGCSRCDYTIEYLKTNNINFVEYATEDKSNNNKMWSAIQKSETPDVDRITMPVIVKDGNVYLSIKDLEEFLMKLAGKQ